jgi:hypothetical protein
MSVDIPSFTKEFSDMVKQFADGWGFAKFRQSQEDGFNNSAINDRVT